MLECLKQLPDALGTCLGRLKGWYDGRVNGDCVMARGKLSFDGALFKKSAPDKALSSVSASGEGELPLLKIGACLGCFALFLLALKLLVRLVVRPVCRF